MPPEELHGDFVVKKTVFTVKTSTGIPDQFAAGTDLVNQLHRALYDVEFLVRFETCLPEWGSNYFRLVKGGSPNWIR